MPDLNLDHLKRMTDRVGLLQHATLSVPNPHYGYCTDDNARALLFTTLALERRLGDPELDDLAERYFRFLQGAFQPNRGTFLNLLAYDGKWVLEAGPGDAGGRALMALGALVGRGQSGPQRLAAKALFQRAMPLVEGLADLRPVANAMLGLASYLRRERSKDASALLEVAALRVCGQIEQVETPFWPWPEPFLTYENARIPQALMAAGHVIHNQEVVRLGLRALDWLLTTQTEDGMFVPIGNRGWFHRGGHQARFDQQPIEAEAMVAACWEAYGHTSKSRWRRGLETSFSWFTGHNTSGLPVCDVDTGGCRDGIGPDGLNHNQGAESTLAWLCASLHHGSLAREQVRPQVVEMGF